MTSFRTPMPTFSQDTEQQHQQQQHQDADFLLQFLKRGPVCDEHQLHDPAVAALGPSHSFSEPPQQVGAPIPPHVRLGWPHHHFRPEQQQTFSPANDNPFLTPTDQAFFHPFPPVERQFHPGAFPFANPIELPRVDSFSGTLMPAPPRFGTVELPDTPTEWQSSRLEQASDRRAGKDGQQVERQPLHQLYGNGAELLQLLQGGSGSVRPVVPTSKADAQVTNVTVENGELDGSRLLPQRVCPSTVHGPIGPPRRQSFSPPQSPNDLLGRFWPVLPCQISSERSHADQTAERIDNGNAFYDQKLDSKDPGLRGESGGGFSLLKRGASKLPLDGFEHIYDSKLGDGAVSKQRGYQSARPQDGYHRARYPNTDPEFEAASDEFRRHHGGGRTDGRRTVAKGGQWVAVNERHRDVEVVENNHRESPDSRDEARRSANGASSKMRDELKRRRKLQQEWRIKCPQAESSSVESQQKLPESRSLASQLEHPGLPSGITQGSAVGAALDESKQRLYNRLNPSDEGMDEEAITQHLADLDLDDSSHEPKTNFFQHKPIRPQRFRETRRYIPMYRRDLWYRPDLQKFTSQLISLYTELIPTEGETERRRLFLSRLDSLVEREWPGARLFLFGSCANAFGVRNSDIDVCLTVDEEEPNKAELVMKMASILDSDDMINVQALPHARVPIVKFTDPVTGMSCDVCVNNMLAVVNSKLLHDYSQVDIRLRQLAFMVKHWAKRRQVNETYRGTLSSYAYVLMCIHFLQQRRPAILPCLQEMSPTYEVKVGHIRCSYYDKVENLRDFGASNKETVGELLTAFFEYWAHEHDYNHAVISVRTGGYLSKDEKNWTRRIGNERHLICIEDPFEVSHDLGRVVDKHSIKALRGEFLRAANIMKSDKNPCSTLFEPFVREEHEQE